MIAARHPGRRCARLIFLRADGVLHHLPRAELATLFGPRAGEVHSAVLMPVNGLGMLAIGSHDMDRFHPGMGTVFLKLIAEAITASVTRYPLN